MEIVLIIIGIIVLIIVFPFVADHFAKKYGIEEYTSMDQVLSNQAWEKELSHNPNLKIIINSFLIPDNISYVKYMNNYKAFNIIDKFEDLDFWERSQSLAINKSDPINPTYSFKKYFSQKIDIPMIGREENWFLIGYPDICAYLNSNDIHQELKELIGKYESIIMKPDLEFLRLLIDEYKRKYHLELKN
tara:strand:- start:696 stop:1262 length:567 start_codon:yes stop_codon:yes gene_type:complete